MSATRELRLETTGPCEECGEVTTLYVCIHADEADAVYLCAVCQDQVHAEFDRWFLG